MGEKQQLREKIALLKKQYEDCQLADWSGLIMNKLENIKLFKEAKCIAVYSALPGEVQTFSFIERHYREKLLLLPRVSGDDLLLLPYSGRKSVSVGAFGILEPILGPDCRSRESEADLIIVPGMAFDRTLNRLGRGRGFYDRLLSAMDVPKIGICYSFQLFDRIPIEHFDKKMDLIITEDEIIG